MILITMIHLKLLHILFLTGLQQVPRQCELGCLDSALDHHQRPDLDGLLSTESVSRIVFRQVFFGELKHAKTIDYRFNRCDSRWWYLSLDGVWTGTSGTVNNFRHQPEQIFSLQASYHKEVIFIVRIFGSPASLDWFCWENLPETHGFLHHQIKIGLSGSKFPIIQFYIRPM